MNIIILYMHIDHV